MTPHTVSMLFAGASFIVCAVCQTANLLHRVKVRREIEAARQRRALAERIRRLREEQPGIAHWWRR